MGAEEGDQDHGVNPYKKREASKDEASLVIFFGKNIL